MSTQHIIIVLKIEKISLTYRHLLPDLTLMINPQRLKQPICATNFHRPNAVWAIEIRLYIDYSPIHQVVLLGVIITVNNLSVHYENTPIQIYWKFYH